MIRVDAQQVKAAAAGQWPALLADVCGFDPQILDRRHHPCPVCQDGDDRFSLVDEEAGAVLCRKCFSRGNGDGLSAIQWATGCTFPEAIEKAAIWLGLSGAAGLVNPVMKASPRVPKRAAKPSKPSFEAWEAAAQSYGLGVWNHVYPYHNVDGQKVGMVLRWNRQGGKEIRPVSVAADGQWTCGAMPAPRPLYRLLALLLAKDEIVVVEGERCCDELQGLGIVAVCSAGGALAAAKSDWSPLGGMDVVVWRDHDASGLKYETDVVEILRGLPTPPKSIRIVDPETLGLGEGEDVADWIAKRDATPTETLAAELRAIFAEAAMVNAEPPVETSGPECDKRRRRQKPANPAENTPSVATPSPVEPFRPFPIGVLPEPLRGFVLAGSKAIGCDPAFLAVPLLTVCAAAIGNSRRVRLKRGWSEPPILWAALLGESGGHKSPALELALRAVRKIQRQALKRYQTAYDQWHRIDLPRFEKDLAEWKRSPAGGEPPVRPDEPVPWRILADDVTIEALAALLQKQPRGLILTADELAAWLASFERYKGKGAGGDAAKWLEVHGGRQLLVDRKSGHPKLLCIPHASVCVLGGIQPGILRRMMTAEHRESGMAARLLVTYPPRRRKQWSEADISDEAEAAIEELLDRLLRLDMDADEDGELAPRLMSLSAEAKTEFVRFYNENADEQSALTGDLCAMWSKLEAYAPRLALVIHCVRWAAGDNSAAREDEIDAESMVGGVTLARWFGHEARRVHALCGETEDQRETRELVEWIARQGGRVTARDLQHRGPRRFRGSVGTADDALSALAAAGVGGWETVETEGRPRREFVLTPPSGDRRSVSQAENHPSVAVASDDVSQVEIGQRWLSDEEADRLTDAF